MLRMPKTSACGACPTKRLHLSHRERFRYCHIQASPCPNSFAVPDSKTDQLIDPTMLFRFEVGLRKHALKWTAKGLKLPATCRMPSFGALGDRPVFADVRMAWSSEGIGVHVTVNGKRQLPWCRETRLDESDGFHVWIDTRCSPATFTVRLSTATDSCGCPPAVAANARKASFAALGSNPSVAEAIPSRSLQ